VQRGLIMTKQAVLMSIAFMALTAGPVLAADLLLKAPALEAPAPIPGWGGFYVGGNAGYSRAKDDLTTSEFTVNSVSIPSAGFAGIEPKGAIGGVQMGYNWQSAYWVYGFETDLQWSGGRDRITDAASVTFNGPSAAACFGDTHAPCSLTGTGTGTLAGNINWFGTFRGRIGIASDQFFWYATGGIAYGQARYSGAASFVGAFHDARTCKTTNGCPASGSATFANSAMGLGWTLGVGVEGVIPFLGNLTWRAEYLFVDLGTITGTTGYSSSVSIPLIHLTQPVNATMTHSALVMDQVLRVGLNYRFGGEAPIVTR